MGEGKLSADFPAWSPVYWPTGKKSSTSSVESSQTTAQTGNVKGTVSTSRSSSTSEIGAATPAKVTQGTPAAQASVARPLTIEDIKAHLLAIQIPDSELNVQLASLMLKYGVELSRDNFIKVLMMLEGTDKSQATSEAAVALISKGIDSPEALKILSNYFAEHPELAAQLLAMQEGIANLQTTLGLGKALLNPALVAQIGALLTQFDELLKGLPGKYKFSGEGSLGRDMLVNDARALKALLEGLQGKMPASQTPESEALTESLTSAANRLNGMLENLVAQAIMSKSSNRQEINYQYYQVPNEMVSPPADMQIVVTRDGTGKEATINPNNTQIIMKLPTTNLGNIVFHIKIKGDEGGEKRIGFLINTENGEARNMIIKQSGDLKGKLMERNYITEQFLVKEDKAMCAINPCFHFLRDDDLKKIFIET